MSIEDLRSTADSLRSIELRRAIRGVDAEQVRELLDKAADALHAAARDQATLRRELEQLRAANDEDSIAKTLLMATQVGERVIADAHEEAAAIVARAEKEASALRESARTDAEAAVAAARSELAQLEGQAAQLRPLVTDMERRIAKIAQDALEELEALGAYTSTEAKSDMLTDLRTAASPLDVAAD
jgi:cell division septum initiation protein DivIVA